MTFFIDLLSKTKKINLEEFGGKLLIRNLRILLRRRLLPGLEDLGKRQVCGGPACNVQEQLRELIVDEGEKQFENLVTACRQNRVEHFCKIRKISIHTSNESYNIDSRLASSLSLSRESTWMLDLAAPTWTLVECTWA